jgi:hypothetical protein
MDYVRTKTYTDRHREMFQLLWDQLFQEIKTCRGVDGKKIPDEILDKIKKEAPADVDASDIYRLEVILYDYLSPHEQKLRLLSLRDMLSNLMTAESFQSISVHFNKNLSDHETNKNESLALSSRLYRRYVMIPSVEALRTSIAFKLLLWPAISCLLAATAAALINSEFKKLFHIDFGYWLAISSGICGAAVSTTIRLYKLDARHEPLLTWLSLERGRLSLYVTPFLGMIFASVLLLLLHAGILQGPLFPNFRVGDLVPPCWENLQPVIFNSKECSTYADISKIIIWCFMAGWSERLVPDVLDKLTRQAAEKNIASVQLESFKESESTSKPKEAE